MQGGEHGHGNFSRPPIPLEGSVSAAAKQHRPLLADCCRDLTVLKGQTGVSLKQVGGNCGRVGLSIGPGGLVIEERSRRPPRF